MSRLPHVLAALLWVLFGYTIVKTIEVIADERAFQDMAGPVIVSLVAATLVSFSAGMTDD